MSPAARRTTSGDDRPTGRWRPRCRYREDLVDPAGDDVHPGRVAAALGEREPEVHRARPGAPEERAVLVPVRQFGVDRHAPQRALVPRQRRPLTRGSRRPSRRRRARRRALISAKSIRGESAVHIVPPARSHDCRPPVRYLPSVRLERRVPRATSRSTVTRPRARRRTRRTTRSIPSTSRLHPVLGCDEVAHEQAALPGERRPAALSALSSSGRTAASSACRGRRRTRAHRLEGSGTGVPGRARRTPRAAAARAPPRCRASGASRLARRQLR
ncbi:MAG: hypothetical protein KatS3mg010_0564 [Acidimicrobiia bacterium]|nr:MAG: hypothetical protein KatS3mg010_0564 [Acidimicrobiia bacterium]